MSRGGPGGAPIQYIPSYNSSSYEWTVLQVTLLNLNLDRCYNLEISNLYRGSNWTFPSYNTYCCTIYLYVGGKVIGRNVVEWNECLCPKKEDWKVRFLHPFYFWFVEGGTVQEHEASSFPLLECLNMVKCTRMYCMSSIKQMVMGWAHLCMSTLPPSLPTTLYSERASPLRTALEGVRWLWDGLICVWAPFPPPSPPRSIASGLLRSGLL